MHGERHVNPAAQPLDPVPLIGCLYFRECRGAAVGLRAWVGAGPGSAPVDVEVTVQVYSLAFLTLRVGVTIFPPVTVLK